MDRVNGGHPQDTAGFRDYLRITRLDHVTKQVFIVPGIVLAWLLRDVLPEGLALTLVTGFSAAIAIASANYVINEWLDREFDAHHPEKSQRAAVQKVMRPGYVYGLYAALLLVGLALAAQVNMAFLMVSGVFAVAGIIYNVRPIRAKDRAYLDVLVESFNNAIRLTLGWTMVDPATLPPASLLLGFWFGGAFLMNAKRLSEYRVIVAEYGRETLGRYRRSFQTYDEGQLSVANLVYALLCAFFLAIFLVKYRIEYILLFPFLTALFAEYYRLALLPDSVARAPERLFKARRLMGVATLTVLAFFFASFVDIPLLDLLAEQHFIELGGYRND